MACRLGWWLGVLVLCTACHTQQPLSAPKPAETNSPLARLEPGLIVLTRRAEPAAINIDPPNARMESVGEGAGTAVRSVLNTPSLAHGQLEAVVSVAEAAVAPFAAVYGAVRSSQRRLSPAKLSEAEQNLEHAMRSNAGSELLRDKVVEAARQKTTRLMVCAASASAVPAGRLPVSAVLELAVEQLSLKADKSEHYLSMAARARLVRACDGAVLLDRTYSYKSGSCLFIDWTRYDALHRVAQTGCEAMAEAIARDIFQPVSEPPLLIGPGHKFSALPRTRSLLAGREASCAWAAERKWQSSGKQPCQRLHRGLGRPKSHAVLCRVDPIGPPRASAAGREDDSGSAQLQPAAEPASVVRPAVPGARLAPVINNAATIEVYTGRDDERLRPPKQGPGVEETTETQTDTEWALDGLANDRNAVVQWTACLAAVPMGLWEQTVGAALKWRRNKTEKLAVGLEALPEQRHFAAGLADEVARHLRSQVLNQVLRTEEPARFALAVTTPVGAGEAASLAASTNCQLALQLQVLDAKLIGKHQHSRSRALCVEVQVAVIRASDGQELYSRSIQYRSSSKRLKDWAAADGRLYRAELDACSRATARALAGELIAHRFVAPAK